MADRLIQIVVPVHRKAELRELIKRVEHVEPWHEPSDTLRLFSVQVPAERVEAILDPVQKWFCKTEGFRAVVVPVEASLPRREEPENDDIEHTRVHLRPLYGRLRASAGRRCMPI